MSAAKHPTIDEQKRFWDWHWQHWQDRKTVNEWKDRRHEMVLSFVSSLGLDNPLILDVGCGPGWYTNKLSRFGTVTGIDLSEEAIQMARSRFPHIRFIARNLYDDPLPAGHFDVVVSQEVIDHVDDSFAFVDKVSRVLKPGGYLIVSCTNRFVVDRLDEQEFPAQPSAHIGRYFDTGGLKRLLRRRFRVWRLETIIPIGHRGVLRIFNSHKLNQLLSAVVSDQFLNRVKEQVGLGYQIIALAQKRP
jgi:SAM-dependent methyltransferase